MESDNVEVVKGGFEAFNERGIDGIASMLHPDFVATTPPELASEPDTYRGEEGIRRWFDSFDDVMDEIRWDPSSFSDAGQDRVIVEFTLRARGKTTGLDFGQEAVMVWTLRDGKALGLDLYPTLEQAKAAAEGG